MEDLNIKLKELQADVFQMYAQAHGYHWNVEGIMFKQLHAFFLEIYEDVFDSIDGISENMRKIQAYAPFGAQAWATNATIEIDDDLQVGPIVMLNELIKTNDHVIESLKDVFQTADVKYNEQGLCNFIADRIDKHQFWAWQLKASLKSIVA